MTFNKAIKLMYCTEICNTFIVQYSTVLIDTTGHFIEHFFRHVGLHMRNIIDTVHQYIYKQIDVYIKLLYLFE